MDSAGLSDRDLGRTLGMDVTSKLVFVLDRSGTLWGRVDGRWEPYPPYPDPEDRRSA